MMAGHIQMIGNPEMKMMQPINLIMSTKRYRRKHRLTHTLSLPGTDIEHMENNEHKVHNTSLKQHKLRDVLSVNNSGHEHRHHNWGMN
jgi:hypothetical protein